LKHFIITIVAAASISLCMACSNKVNKGTSKQKIETNNSNDTMAVQIKITVGSAVFTATFNNNATATAFTTMLPLTITMSELNGNEKYYYFSSALPTNASGIGNIQAGDLMLYGNNCLVLFYESFNTAFSYTRIGRINNPSGLAEALGKDNITVRFEIQ
jgi:hypothetical protein